MTKTPVVLHITKWFPHEKDPQLGVFVEKHVRSVMPHCRVHVLHIHGDDVDTAQISQFEKDGLNVTRLTFPSEKSSIYKLCTFRNQVQRAVKSIPTPFQSPDIIHAHILAQPTWIARKFFPGVPVINTEHWTGFVNGYFEKLPVWKRLMFKQAAAKSRVVTVPSEALKSAMMSKHQFKGRFEVVPNVIESTPGVSRPESSTPLILSVADLHDHNKNISGSLNALAGIDEDFRFEIVGDGQDKIALEQHANDLGLLDKKAFFLGRMDNSQVLEKLKSAAFLLINSQFETFSMIAAEALLTGVPVLTTRCGGPEQFIEESNGLLIEKDNSDQLKDAIHKMLKEFQDYDREQIARDMGSKFSMEAVGAQFQTFYKEILEN